MPCDIGGLDHEGYVSLDTSVTCAGRRPEPYDRKLTEDSERGVWGQPGSLEEVKLAPKVASMRREGEVVRVDVNLRECNQSRRYDCFASSNLQVGNRQDVVCSMRKS